MQPLLWRGYCSPPLALSVAVIVILSYQVVDQEYQVKRVPTNTWKPCN